MKVSFLQRTKKQMQPTNQHKGVILWILLMLGYMVFIISWFGVLYSAPSWSKEFGVNLKNPVYNQVPNWTITLMRSVGALFSGFLIVKFGHRRAILIALGLMLASFPFIFSSMGSLNGTETGFVMFIIFRLLLAVGGTVLIIYTQPILATYVKSAILKATLSRLNIFTTSVAIVIINSLFTNGNLAKLLAADWKVFSAVCLGIVFIVTLVFLFFDNQKVCIKHKMKLKREMQSMFVLLKDRKILLHCVLAVFWLIILVTPLTGLTKSVVEFSSQKIIFSFSFFNLLVIVFVVGSFSGYWLIGSFLKTKYSRKKWLVFSFGLGLVFWAVVLSLGYSLPASNVGRNIFMFLLTFLAGNLLWGAQGVILNLPHEMEKNDFRTIGHVYSLMWAIGYFGYTSTDIAFSFVIRHSVLGFLIFFLIISVLIIPLLFCLQKPSNEEKAISFRTFMHSYSRILLNQKSN